MSILSGKIAPGEVLPTEAGLGASLHVSRTAIREAIKVLTSKGLVEVRRKTGTRVRPRKHWKLPQTAERLRAGTCAENASTSDRPPITSGVLWCMAFGTMLRIRSSPLVAIPPACSAINASGFAS